VGLQQVKWQVSPKTAGRGAAREVPESWGAAMGPQQAAPVPPDM